MIIWGQEAVKKSGTGSRGLENKSCLINNCFRPRVPVPAFLHRQARVPELLLRPWRSLLPWNWSPDQHARQGAIHGTKNERTKPIRPLFSTLARKNEPKLNQQRADWGVPNRGGTGPGYAVLTWTRTGLDGSRRYRQAGQRRQQSSARKSQNAPNEANSSFVFNIRAENEPIGVSTRTAGMVAATGRTRLVAKRLGLEQF